jgi:hypothetical protein
MAVLFIDHVIDHHEAVGAAGKLLQAVVEDDDALEPDMLRRLA